MIFRPDPKPRRFHLKSGGLRGFADWVEILTQLVCVTQLVCLSPDPADLRDPAGLREPAGLRNPASLRDPPGLPDPPVCRRGSSTPWGTLSGGCARWAEHCKRIWLGPLSRSDWAD